MLTGQDMTQSRHYRYTVCIDVYLLSTTLANSSLPQNNSVSSMGHRLTVTRSDSSLVVTVNDADSVM